MQSQIPWFFNPNIYDDSRVVSDIFFDLGLFGIDFFHPMVVSCVYHKTRMIST